MSFQSTNGRKVFNQPTLIGLDLTPESGRGRDFSKVGSFRRVPSSTFMLPAPARDALFKSTKALFRFRGCLVAKQNSRRYISASSRTLARPTTTPLPPSPDDQALVAVFDQPSSSTFKKPLFSTPSGLFGHGVLAHPRGLITLAEATLVRAQILTNRILRARQSRDELMKVVKNLDRLSDMLCSVIDLAELVRNAHPDHAWVDAANEAYETLCEFMNVLNTHVGLYEVCSHSEYAFIHSPLHVFYSPRF